MFWPIIGPKSIMRKRLKGVKDGYLFMFVMSVEIIEM